MAISTYLPPPDTARLLFSRTLALAYRIPRWIPDPSYYIQHDAQALEKAEQDGVAAQVMQHRRHLVAGTTWGMETDSDRPADKRLAGVAEEVFRDLANFESARFNLADAVFTGSRFAFQRWVPKMARYGDGKPRRWFVCDELQDIDRRSVRLQANRDRKRDEPIRVWMEVYSPQRNVWVKPSRPDLFVRHVYGDSQSSLGYGNGLLNALFNTLWAKEEVMTQGLRGLARWANGLLLVKMDGTRDAQTSRPNTTLVQEWIDFFAAHTSSHVGVYDKSDEIEVKDGPSTGHEMVREWRDYLDNVIRVLVLGSNLPTSADGGGSYALAEVQAASTEALIRYDRVLLASTLTRDLLGAFVRLNAANLREMGLGEARTPRFAISQETVEDPNEAIQVAAQALSSGIPLVKEVVYRKIGYPMPSADDEVFVGTAANGLGSTLGGGPVLPTGDEIDRMLNEEAGAGGPPPRGKDGEAEAAA